VRVEKARLYKVAYDEAVRALSEQQAEIDSFRTRGGMLLSAAAITTSFLGSEAGQGRDSGSLAWAALTVFGAVAVLSLALLWPYVWQVTMDPHVIVAIYIESDEPMAMEALHRDLIDQMRVSYLKNREGLDLLAVLFQISSGLLALEIVLWTFAVAATP
jgi:hypothetical protein